RRGQEGEHEQRGQQQTVQHAAGPLELLGVRRSPGFGRRRRGGGLRFAGGGRRLDGGGRVGRCRRRRAGVRGGHAGKSWKRGRRTGGGGHPNPAYPRLGGPEERVKERRRGRGVGARSGDRAPRPTDGLPSRRGLGDLRSWWWRGRETTPQQRTS